MRVRGEREVRERERERERKLVSWRIATSNVNHSFTLSSIVGGLNVDVWVQRAYPTVSVFS